MHVEGLALGGGLVALVAVLVLTVPEAPTTTRSDTPLLPGVLLALRNRPNLLLLPVWLLANVAVYTAMAVLPFWVQYVLRPPDGQRELWFLAVCGATYGAALVAIPFWSYVAEHPRSSKKQATLVSWACSLVIAGLLLPLGEGQFVAAVVLCFLLGATMAGWNFLFFALQADVVDYDELHTGVRREAQCAAARRAPIARPPRPALTADLLPAGTRRSRCSCRSSSRSWPTRCRWRCWRRRGTCRTSSRSRRGRSG